MNLLAWVLTLAVLASSVLLIVATRRAGRGGGGVGTVHDVSEAAFLGGGPARVVDTALTALHADGRLVIGGPGIVAVRRAEARDPVERAVLQELAGAPSGALHSLRDAVMRHPAVQETGDGLAARGLLVPPGESRSRRRWALIQGIGCIVAIPVCLMLTFAQYALHEGYADIPFPFIVKMLPALGLGCLVGLLAASSARARITGAGRRAADAYRAAHPHVGAPEHLVATLGLSALPDAELRAQLLAAARIRTPGRAASPSHVTASSAAPALWCAGVSPGGSSCGSSGGSGCGGGSGSGCSSGSSCGGGSGSSCGGSSGSSCGGGSSCGSSS